MSQNLGPPEVSFDNEDEIQNQIIQQIKNRTRNAFVAISVFVLIVSALALFRFYSTASIVEDGYFYNDILLSTQLQPFWKELAEEQEQKKDKPLIEQGQHKITRQELGHMGWTILHMMTGSFPQYISPNLVKKWNAFLVLFGQMYPGKLCANHFMKMLKQVGPFKGTTKKELMTYLCQMHNIVNARLGKPKHSCEGVQQQWNTCGCSGDR